MVSDMLMENLLEDVGELREDLLFQGVGEPVPDGPWRSVHAVSHSFNRASNSSRAALVNLVRDRVALSGLRSVAWTGMRSRRQSR